MRQCARLQRKRRRVRLKCIRRRGRLQRIRRRVLQGVMLRRRAVAAWRPAILATRSKATVVDALGAVVREP